MADRRLVWDSEQGPVRPAKKPAPAAKGDGTLRIRREIGGRRGKTVTTIRGFRLPAAAIAELARELKRRCGVGGSVKDGVLELQGDVRDIAEEELRARGFVVKRAGG